MHTLACDETERLGETMNYSKYVKSTPRDQLGESIRNLENLLGLQQSYLSTHANSRNRLGSSLLGGWQGNGDREPQTPVRGFGGTTQIQGLARTVPHMSLTSSAAGPGPKKSDPKMELELERMRQDVEMQRKRNVWEQEDRQRAIDARNAQQGHWSQLKSFPGGLTEGTNLQGANLLSKVPAASTRKKSSSR
jgi:hypothetical protein